MGTETPLRMLVDARLITCILPHGRAMPLLKMLKSEWGILAANVNHARGTGRITPLAYRGAGEQTMKEIVTVLVDGAHAEALFEAIYDRSEINRPHGGMMFQSVVPRASCYELPAELPEEQ